MNPLLLGKKKSILTLIGAEEPKEESNPEEMMKEKASEAMDEGDQIAKEVAAKLILKAIDMKSPKMLAKAMKQLIMLCDEEGYGEEEVE